MDREIRIKTLEKELIELKYEKVKEKVRAINFGVTGFSERAKEISKLLYFNRAIPMNYPTETLRLVSLLAGEEIPANITAGQIGDIVFVISHSDSNNYPDKEPLIRVKLGNTAANFSTAVFKPGFNSISSPAYARKATEKEVENFLEKADMVTLETLRVALAI